ncbi:MAG TPA: hypothetical protein PKB12_08115, partial [Elusimicrobiota bacterium]|nr:hypothetical protein [Elusimicrobiota bacterium]
SETAIQYDGLQILSANTAKENEILYSLSPLKAIVEYWAYLNRPGGTTVDWSKVTAEQRSYMENLVSTISGLLTSAVPLQSAMAGLVQKTQTTGRGASGASTSQTGSTNLDLTDFLPIFSTLNNLNEKLLAEVEAVLASVSGPQPSGISGALSSILQGINRMLDLKTKLAGTIAGGGLKGVPKQYTESTTQNTYAIVAGQAVLMNASTNSDTFTGFGAHDPHPVTTTHTTSRTDYSYNDVGLLIGAMALSDSRTTNTVLSDGSPQVVVSTARTRSVYTVINGQAQVRESTTNSHSDGSGGASITDSQSTTYYRYDREGHLIGAFGQGEGTTQQLVGNHGGTATQITTSKTTQHYGVFWGQAMVTETITEANTVSNGGTVNTASRSTVKNDYNSFGILVGASGQTHAETTMEVLTTVQQDGNPKMDTLVQRTVSDTTNRYVIILGQAMVSQTLSHSSGQSGATASGSTSQINYVYNNLGQLIDAQGYSTSNSSTGVWSDLNADGRWDVGESFSTPGWAQTKNTYR